MGDRAAALELLRTELMDEVLELLEYTSTRILDATRQHGDLVAVLAGELNEYMACPPAEQMMRLPVLVTQTATLLRNLVDEHDVVDDDTAELLDDLLGRISDCSIDAGVIEDDDAEAVALPSSAAPRCAMSPRERLSVLYPANPPEQPAPRMSVAMVPPQAPRLEAKVPLDVAPLRAPLAPEPLQRLQQRLQNAEFPEAAAAPASEPDGSAAAPPFSPELALLQPPASSPPLSPTAGAASGVEKPAPTAVAVAAAPVADVRRSPAYRNPGSATSSSGESNAAEAVEGAVASAPLQNAARSPTRVSAAPPSAPRARVELDADRNSFYAQSQSSAPSAANAAPSNIDAAVPRRRLPPPSVERTSDSAASAAAALRALRAGAPGTESAPEELARLLLVGEIFATLAIAPEAQAERTAQRAPRATLGSGTMISFLSVVLSATRGLYYTPTEAEILAIFQSVPFDDGAQRWISRGAFVEWVRGYDYGALWTDATLSAIHEQVCSVHGPVRADDCATSPLAQLQRRMAQALASPTPTRRELELELGVAAPAAAPAAARVAYDARSSVHSVPASVHDLVSSPHHLKAIMLSMDQLQAEWRGRATTGAFAAESSAYASSSGVGGSALPSTPAPTKRSEGDYSGADAPPEGVGALLKRIAELEAENTRLNAILTPEKAKSTAPAPTQEWSLLAADLQAEIAAEAAVESSVPADAASALRLVLEESQSVGERVALDLLKSVNSGAGAVTVDSIEEQTRMLEELRLATEKAQLSLEGALAVQKRHRMSGEEARRSERDALERELRIATKALM
jgi:hypothetical protein